MKLADVKARIEELKAIDDWAGRYNDLVELRRLETVLLRHKAKNFDKLLEMLLARHVHKSAMDAGCDCELCQLLAQAQEVEV